MEYVLIGTAGHVDHGKSTLIKALSGIDPDRLKEEKEREMTIDIGFANFKLPSGRLAQVIDVPGHERFIKNMLAGVSTIDLVLLLVDANEGVKPQTQEHFDILKLMGIKTGIIVLTKIDLADDKRTRKSLDEISDLVKDSFLEAAPIVKVSSVKGDGIKDLVQTIDKLAGGVPKRNKELPARLPIDRVFTMTGSGTVITGTLISGLLKVNDTLEILPQKHKVRVRQIQSYGGKTEKVVAGQRAGINLAGAKKDDLIRGNTLAQVGYIKPTYMFDATLELLADCPRPLKNNTRVRLHIGSGEFLGRIILLDKEKLDAGKTALIQFRSESPLVITKDERFVIRFYAPMITIGGGKILDPHPEKHKRFQNDTASKLKSLVDISPLESIEQVLINNSFSALEINEISDKVNLPAKEINDILKTLEEKKKTLTLKSKIMHRDNFKELQNKIIELMEKSYKKDPLKLNIPIKDIKLKLKKFRAQDNFVNEAIKQLIKEKKALLTSDSIKLTKHSVKLTPKQEELKNRIEKFYLDNLFGPPGLEQLTASLNMKSNAAKQMINTLKEMGILIALSEGIVLHQRAINEASKIIKDYFKENKNIKAGGFTKLLKTSRKFAIPILEHLDSIKLTKREGDVRVLC